MKSQLVHHTARIRGNAHLVSPYSISTRKRNAVSLLAFCCLVFFAVLTASAQTNIPTLYLSPEQKQYNALNSSYWSVLNDTTMGKLTIDDVASDAFQARFHAVSAGTLPVGLRNVVFWLRLSVCDTISPHASLWTLVSKDFISERTDIYIQQKTPNDDSSHVQYKQTFTHVSSGSIVPLPKRNIAWYGIAENVVVPPRTPVMLYMRITSHYVAYDMSLFSGAAFAEHIMTEHYRFGLYYGAMLLLVVYNIILWFALRERMFVLLSGYILSVMLHQCTQDGMMYEIFPFAVTKLRILWVTVSNECSVLALSFLMLEFIPLRSTDRRISFFLNVCIALSVVQFVIGFFLTRPQQLTLLNYQMISTPLVLMTIMLVRWRETALVERIFATSCVVMFVSEGLYSLTVLGWVSMTWVEWYIPMQTGMVMQAVLLSFATGIKVNALSRERAQALAKAEQSEQYRLQSEALQKANAELDAALVNLKETQTQLVASERLSAVGLLTAGVMHEINNPNAAVYAALEQMQIREKDVREFFLSLLSPEEHQSAEARKFLTMNDDLQRMILVALDGAARVKQIVSSLRTFTRHQEYGVKSAPLSDELATTLDIFRYQFKNVDIRCEFIGNTVIQANFGEINQVFLNLFVNAAQAGATTILFRAEEETDKGVVVRVSDNGGGIPQNVLQHIFEPFYTTKGTGNSGLGLSISKGILEQHKARLKVESRTEASSGGGTGTTFIIRFPITMDNQVEG